MLFFCPKTVSFLSHPILLNEESGNQFRMSSALLSSVGRGGQAGSSDHRPSIESSQTPSGSIPHHNDAQQQSPEAFLTGDQSQPSGSIWHSLTNPSSNPLLTTGLSLLIFGSLLSMGRKGVTQGATLLQRRALVSLEIPSKDRSHSWLLAWMEEQAKIAQRQAQTSPQQSNSKELWQDALDLVGMRSGPPRPVMIISRDLAAITANPAPAGRSQAEQEAEAYTMGGALPGNATRNRPTKAAVSLVPGPGTHYFRYQGTWIKLHRERSGKLLDVTTGSPWETLTLTTLYGSRSIFPRLLEEAESLASAKSEGKTTIYTAWNLDWRAFGNARKTRQLSSVVLTRGQRDRIVGDISAFLSRGQWYARRGIPYRRGYLLHGSPGSGKTSMVQALAGEMDLNICLLNLGERGLTDDRLTHLLSKAPERSILLLEDIDAAFPSRTAQDERDGDNSTSRTSGSSAVGGGNRPSGPEREYQTSVTFSGLLNALDGVASGESRIVVMTTNHVERLDPALIRPGRVDLIEELGDADEGMVRDLFDRFYSASGSLATAARADREAKIGQTSSANVPSSGTSGSTSSDAEPSSPNSTSSQQGSVDASDPFAVPALSPAQFDSLQQRLAVAVRQVSTLRRHELGLEASGRFKRGDGASASNEDSNTGAASTMAQRTKAKTLPAARGGVSMAELQGLFIRYPLDPAGAVAEMEEEARRATSSTK